MPIFFMVCCLVENIQKIVHIDLKGSPPTLDYLFKLIRKLAKLGVTGVMIEYEDMFPYDGTLSDLAAKSAFSRLEVSTILD